MEFDKAQKMLLGIAIGDAFGMPYEAHTREMVKQEIDMNSYKSRARPNKITNTPEFHIAAGMYTDDTQMSIGVSELLASNKQFNHENLAESFIKCYKRDLIYGYSAKSKKALDNVTSGKELLHHVDTNRTSNGAAMRAVPIGIVKDLETAIEYAIINSQITHNTPESIASSVAVTLMSHYYFNNISDRKMFWYLEPHIKNISIELTTHLKEIDEMMEENPVTLFGEENIVRGVTQNSVITTGAVFYILSNFYNPWDVLKNSVLLGGDTDSVSSISLGINLMNSRVNQLPEFSFRDLTNHKYGKDYILQLGKKLSDKYLK